MKRIILLLAVVWATMGWAMAAKPTDVPSYALVNKVFTDVEAHPQWNQQTGEALTTVAYYTLRYDDEALWQRALQLAASLISEKGQIAGLEQGSDQDRYAAAPFLFAAYERTGEKRYRRAIETLYTYYESHTAEADYLAVSPFLAQYARRYGKRKTGDVRAVTFRTVAAEVVRMLDAADPTLRVEALAVAVDLLDFLPAKEAEAQALRRKVVAMLPATHTAAELYASLKAVRTNLLKGAELRKQLFAEAEQRLLQRPMEGTAPHIVGAAVEWEALTNRDRIVEDDPARLLAFPGAEGGGRYTTGGRGGKVLTVTKLTDDGSEGTLRWAVSQKYPRTVVFAVAGNIELQRPLKINTGDLTIAGQSAPGAGVTICNYSVDISADNIIIRYMRFRMGDRGREQADALSGMGNRGMIIDHCSMSWSTDECASFYANRDFTMQWCLLAESLTSSVHAKGSHGYGGIWGGRNATYHHNLLAHHTSRNPRLDHPVIYRDTRRLNRRGTVEVVNNVIYNWGFKATYGGEEGWWNLIGNYYKAGPSTKHPEEIIEIWDNRDTRHTVGSYYLAGNELAGNKAVTKQNWLGVEIEQNRTREEVDHQIPFRMPTGNYAAQKAEAAYRNVLAEVGASLCRDAIDQRIVEEVRRGTTTYHGSKSGAAGHIDSQEDVGGWPLLPGGEPQPDSDGDGMPDSWETEHGLDPQNEADGVQTTLDGRYTNVEVYLNGLLKK